MYDIKIIEQERSNRKIKASWIFQGWRPPENEVMQKKSISQYS